MRFRAIATAALLAVGTSVLAGCGEDAATGPRAGSGSVTLSLAAAPDPGSSASVQTSAPRALSPAVSVTRTDGQGNELVLDSLQLVLEEVELKRAFVDSCPDDSDTGTDDECEEFETDIRLFRVPLDGGIEETVTIQVPADTYDELEFEIDDPDDDEADDRQFMEENPTFAEISVRALGSYTPAGGQTADFVFAADIDAEQEVPLSPPLEVAEGESVNVTLRVDWPRWFTDDGTSSGTLVDPATANDGGPNEDLVEENIQNSFDVFEDDDRDGEDDDGGDDDS